MFRRRLIDGWAGFRIARELDDLSIRWATASPGASQRSTTSSAIPSTPARHRQPLLPRHLQPPIGQRPQTVAHRSQDARAWKKPKQEIRPRDEWIEIAHPLLKDYLGDLRDRAIAWQKEELKKQDRARVPAPASKDRHIDSRYFLRAS